MDSKYIADYKYIEGLADGERQYDDEDLSGKVKIVDAKYVKSPIASYVGNPYIEALPMPRNIGEIMTACERGLPGFVQDIEIQKSQYQQLLDVTELRNVRFTLPMNIDLEQECYRALCLSYAQRSLSYDNAINVKYTSGTEEKINHGYLTSDDDDSANAGFSLIGYSGCGKSSALHALFANYPQVIIHHGKDMSTYPQIVYLVVNCPAHSNFRELYKNIGTAIDRALGNIKPVYAAELGMGSSSNLGLLNDKVRELIELFGIGIIIFDEIQLLSFDSSTENSFQGLLHLSNRTKVAFGVVGTEDAREKIFGTFRILPDYVKKSKKSRKEQTDLVVGNLRQARRLGTEIKADSYCDEYGLFHDIVIRLFEFQWFNERINPDEDMIKALYNCSKGIIDQLIGIYMYMQIDYIRRTRKPLINADYVYATAEKHYPGIQKILQQISDPQYEAKRAEMAKAANQAVDDLVKSEQVKASSDTVHQLNQSGDATRLAQLKANVVTAILSITDDYTQDSIEQTFNRVIGTKAGKQAAENQMEINRLVYKKLLSGKIDKRPATPKPSKSETGTTIRNYLADDTTDDLLDN